MADWVRAVQDREQIVLFPQRLDQAIAGDHRVRLLDEMLRQLDWSDFEARYATGSKLGRPPFHPRVLAGVILYGMITCIRASRKLEEALQVRLDFRWLAEGHRIDHTTLSEFRRKHPDELKGLFVQIGQIAQQLGILRLGALAFDGTRIKASNNRHRSKTPARLRELQRELAATFEEQMAEADEEERRETERFGDGAGDQLPPPLADVKKRARQIQGAIQKLDELEAAGEQPPQRIPLTDPDSRITPNKEGGFAANYTPLAGVDIQSGLIVTGDVLPGTDEEQHLLAAIEDVEQQFGETPQAMLADGLFATAANLKACEEQEIILYSPSGAPDPHTNPAVREDPTQPVPSEQHDQLPTKKVKGGGEQLTKYAFVYDAEQDCYWCPNAQDLQPKQTTTDERKDGTKIKRTRYQAQAAACAACPLQARCLTGKKQRGRTISRDQFEPYRERHAQRMATDQAQQKYAQRRSPGERLFGTIKQAMSVRQFLLRSLERVKTEWLWLMTAFNLKRLIAGFSEVLRARPGPPSHLSSSTT